MRAYNVFLSAPPSRKGGGLFLEDPAMVENIALQTAAREPDALEVRLAEEMVRAFEEGASELEQLVEALNARGSRDARGHAWTATSLREQLALSASRLFMNWEAPHGD